MTRSLPLLSVIGVTFFYLNRLVAFTQSFTCRTKFVPPSTVHRDLNFQKLFARPPVKSTENIETNSDGKRRFLSKNLPRSLFLSSALTGLTYLGLANAAPPGFKRIPIQFIAALGDPKSNSGTNVNEWGLWPVDPGPRGVYLRDYERSLAKKKDGKAPAGWTFDKNNWWLEEHGLIMEAPDFPLAEGRYLVTGGRTLTTVLTVGGKGDWNLEKGELYDVTHLPCRSAKYTPNDMNGSPLTANQSDFPVTPGAEMPKVDGCNKLDYAVLFVIGKEDV